MFLNLIKIKFKNMKLEKMEMLVITSCKGMEKAVNLTDSQKGQCYKEG